MSKRPRVSRNSPPPLETVTPKKADRRGAWRKPKVIISLLGVLVTAAGVVAAVLTSKPSVNRQGDTFNGPVEQRGPEPAAPQANPDDPPAAKAAPAPTSATTRQKHKQPRAQVGQSRAPAREVSAATSAPAQPSISDSTIVSNSPGAITFGHVNANSIEVRPPR